MAPRRDTWPFGKNILLLTLAVGFVSIVVLLAACRTLFGQFPVALSPKATWSVSTTGFKNTAVCLLYTRAGHIIDALDIVQEERTQVLAERDAFDAFLTRVTDISPVQPSRTPVPSNQVVINSSVQVNRLEKIQQAYRETVMDVPHYDAEYSDTVAESLAAEFGPNLAAQLHSGDTFTSLHKRQLVQAAHRCRHDRERFLSILENEETALTAAQSTLEAVETSLEQVSTTHTAEWTFDELVDAYTDLDEIEQQCDELLLERQGHRIDGHASIATPRMAVPDLQTYLYQMLPVTYPVLADTTDLLDRLRRIRRQITSEITSWG